MAAQAFKTAKLASAAASAPFRSFLFLNKGGLKNISKMQTRPDWFLIDFEDGCAPRDKVSTRILAQNVIRAGDFAGENVCVRLNNLENLSEIRRDLKHVMHENVKAYLCPKLRSVNCLRTYEELIAEAEYEAGIREGHSSIFVNIECPAGVLNAQEIGAASARNVAVAFGHADYLAESGGSYNFEGLFAAKSLAVMAAKANKLHVIDTPHLKIADLDGLEKESVRSRDMGFSGKFALHPSQLSTIHRVFTPSVGEVQEAERILAASNGIAQETGAFVGPPHRLKAAQVLDQATRCQPRMMHAHGMHASAGAPTVVGTSRRYGRAPDKLAAGMRIESPYELTLTEGMRMQWHSFFYTPGRADTSDLFAKASGIAGGAVIPYDLMLNLAMGCSVDVFSETCKLHLGLADCVYERPAHAGDTVRNEVEILRVGEPTSSGKYRVVESLHSLTNQRGERVFSLVKRSLFDANEMKGVAAGTAAPSFTPARHFDAIFKKDGARFGDVRGNHFGHAVRPNQLLLHGASRPIGVSENLLFCNMMRNTHSLHYDTQRYSGEGDILVSGGYILSSVLALSGRDLREIVHQEIVGTSHVGKLRPMDPLGAISFVRDVKPIAGTNYEEVLVKTIGLKGVDAERDLGGKGLPLSLFDDWDARAFRRPSEYQRICETQFPALHNRIVMQIVRKVIRPRTATAAA